MFPAIAIADEVKKLEPNADILFIGTKEKIEAQVIPQRGYAFQTIWVSGFHRRLRLSNLLFPLKVIVSLMQAKSIIQEFKPNVVVGTGGYVSGPVLRAATMLKVPTLIQEQNSYPGVTTRMLAERVNEVHLTFESSKRYLKRTDNVYASGNPTRSDLENVDRTEAFQYFGFDPTEQMKTVLVFGGSLGAHTINLAMRRSIDQIVQRNVRVIWQTGKEDAASAQRATQAYSPRQVWVSEFIDRMDYAYAVGDLVVCRAGATTIAELTRLGKPAILIPYPFAAANHQVENARSLAETDAAKIVYDNQLPDKFLTSVLELLDDRQLKRMSEQSRKLGKPNAANVIAQRVLNLAKVPNLRKVG